MANMDYCRFRNTLSDLQDCYDHLRDDDLSEDEERARQHLIDLCAGIVEETAEESDD